MVRLSDVVRQQGNHQEEESVAPEQTLTPPNDLFENEDLQRKELNPLDSNRGGIDWVNQAEKAVIRLGRAIKQNTPISLEGFDSIASGIVHACQESEDLVHQVFSRRSTASALTSNSVNVAILAARVGLGVYRNQQDLINITKASLLHNIGKFPLPSHLTGSPKSLTPEEKQLFHQHPELGRQILEPFLEPKSWLLETLFQVDERWDGQGFPHGRKGDQIHPYARLIGLVDAFDNLLNQNQMLPHEAVRQFLTVGKNAFPGNLLKMLVQQISLFPVGTVVRLSTNETAMVVKTHPRYPLRPVVRIMNDPTEEVGRQLMRDLSYDHLIHVVEVAQP